MQINRKSVFAVLGAAAVSVGLAACSFLPSSGPTSRQVDSQDRGASENYVVIDLTHQVVGELAATSNVGLSRRLLPSKIKNTGPRIGVGDVLAITIWEAGEGGLFSSQSNKSVSFPQLVVGPSGEISLPYAGQIKVAGKEPLEVQKRIIEGLSDRAIQPQAVVSVVENKANTIILNGDVTKPGPYPLSLQGDRLLDVIAAAGGTKFPARETTVLVMRKEQKAEQLLKSIVEDPQENILLQTGDRIFVNHEPRRFTVVGAVPKPGVYPFESIQVNILEAIAATGGLMDERADATGVFVFRYENADFVGRFSSNVPTKFGNYVPVAYRVNLRNPEAYFFAKGFSLRDKDVVYVANAEGTELAKALRLLNLGTASVGVGRRVID